MYLNKNIKRVRERANRERERFIHREKKVRDRKLYIDVER
jgi:hypothetical protein